MKLYWKDIVIAEVVGDNLICKDRELVPPDLFSSRDPDSVPVTKFMGWACKRVFSPKRQDLPLLLAELGLEVYDPMQIILKTNARLEGHDWYSIDFGNGRGDD